MDSVKSAIKNPDLTDLPSSEETDEKNTLQEGQLLSVWQDNQTTGDKDSDNEGKIFVTEGGVRGNDRSNSGDAEKYGPSNDTAENTQTCMDNEVGKLVVEGNGVTDQLRNNFTVFIIQTIGKIPVNICHTDSVASDNGLAETKAINNGQTYSTSIDCIDDKNARDCRVDSEGDGAESSLRTNIPRISNKQDIKPTETVNHQYFIKYKLSLLISTPMIIRTE